jgi:hypothetical protein
VACETGKPNHDGTGDDYGCKLRAVSFAPSAMPNRHPAAADEKALDRRLNRDLPAYKRMVDAGIQPKATRGAADIESRAHEKFEVEHGQTIADPKMRRRVDRALAEASSGGLL